MLKKALIGIILNGASLYGVIYVMPNDILYTGGVKFFAVGAIVMGLLNTIVKPVLKLLTLPIHILTVGLSLILLNGIIFWIFKNIIDTIAIEGVTLAISKLSTYILAGLLFGIINWIEHLIIHNK